jgi:hypothetical protein
MEARPFCKLCQSYLDPSTPEGVRPHVLACADARLKQTLSDRAIGGLRLPGEPVLPYKTYRPKRRKKSSFK